MYFTIKTLCLCCSRWWGGPAAVLVRIPKQDPCSGVRGGLLGQRAPPTGQDWTAPPPQCGASAACGHPGKQAGNRILNFLYWRFLARFNPTNTRTWPICCYIDDWLALDRLYFKFTSLYIQLPIKFYCFIALILCTSFSPVLEINVFCIYFVYITLAFGSNGWPEEWKNKSFLIVTCWTVQHKHWHNTNINRRVNTISRLITIHDYGQNPVMINELEQSFISKRAMSEETLRTITLTKSIILSIL